MMRTLSHIAAAAALVVAGGAWAGGGQGHGPDKGTSAGNQAGQPASAGTMARGQTEVSPAGHVAVDISAIKPEVGAKLQVNQARLPTVVEVPAAVAAEACDMPESDVSNSSGSGVTACRATDSSPQLESAIRQELSR